MGNGEWSPIDALNDRIDRISAAQVANHERNTEKLEAIGITVGEIATVARETAAAVKIQNGRVRILEDKELERRLKEAKKQGYDEGRATAVITKTQWRALIGVVTGSATLVGAIIGAIMKFA